MTSSRPRLLLAASALLLVAVVLAWASWPTTDGRADLRTVPPLTTTTVGSVPDPSTSTTGAPASTTAVPTTVPPPAGIEPLRLQIPAIAVDAAVVPVGLAADGQMEIPTASDVGWYRLGPRPGDPGSAVLAAHIDYGGEPGAFFRLGGIPVGAEVLVGGPSGERRFVVTAREQVAKAEIQLERYFTAEGPGRLTLITCGGAFSRSSGHYEDNLVITAEPVP